MRLPLHGRNGFPLSIYVRARLAFIRLQVVVGVRSVLLSEGRNSACSVSIALRTRVVVFLLSGFLLNSAFD